MSDTLTVLILAAGFFALFNELRHISNRLDEATRTLDGLLEEIEGDYMVEEEQDV